MRNQKHTCPRRTELTGENSPYVVPEHDTWTRTRGSRHCSWCGSMHPDDLMVIARNGAATLGPTDKSYKVYVQRDKGQDKFYFQHLSEDQRREFVDLYNNRPRRTYGPDLDYTVDPQDADKTGMSIGYPGHFYQLPFFMGH